MHTWQYLQDMAFNQKSKGTFTSQTFNFLAAGSERFEEFENFY